MIVNFQISLNLRMTTVNQMNCVSELTSQEVYQNQDICQDLQNTQKIGVQNQSQLQIIKSDNILEKKDSVKTSQQISQQKIIKKEVCFPYKMLTGHWMTISRPQYQRTCGISSLVSLWNYQYSKLGLGTRDPISIEQAMLKLNLIGNGSIQQNMRKRFKKTAQLTQKSDQINNETKQLFDDTENEEKIQDPQIRNSNMSLNQYISKIDFGCFTGNDTLLKWYRLLCRIYGGSGRSYIFYKTNSDRSQHKNEQSAKKALIQGLNSNGKTCFIYHAYDHYFCPVGYQFVTKNEQNASGTFHTDQLRENDNQLYIMIGQSSKMFPCMHVVKWSEIQLDLETYWPKFFNIRRRKQGVQFFKGKQNELSRGNTIDCIMAFQKIKD